MRVMVGGVVMFRVERAVRCPFMSGTARIRITQYDFKLTADRSEHEARGNEGPQAQHSQYERSRPMASTPVT